MNLASLVLLLHLSLSVGLSLVLLTRRREPVVTLAWILGFFLVPFVSVLLYLFFGYQKYHRRKRLKNYLSAVVTAGQEAAGQPDGSMAARLEVSGIKRLVARLTGMPAVPGNRIAVILEPKQSHDALADAIERAQSHVHAEFYIWRDDSQGRRFQKLLINAASRGVECRLLLDAVGCLHLKDTALSPMRNAGVRIEYFSPLFRFRRLWHLHLRNHRKLAVVDGKVGFIGSQNIVDSYSGMGESERLWNEGQVLLEGPVVAQLQSVFMDDWRFTTREKVNGRDLYPNSGKVADGVEAQLLPTGPDLASDSLHFIFMAMIHCAQKEVVIVSPYLVPSNPMAMAIRAAARRGVRVSIVLPKRSDNFLAQMAGRGWYENFMENGVEIYEYAESLLHAKMILVDRYLVLIGSANMDARSFEFNFEAGVLIYNAEIGRELYGKFERIINASSRIGIDSLRRTPLSLRIVEGACRLLTPVL